VQAKLRDSATARSAEFDKRCLQFLQKVPFLFAFAPAGSIAKNIQGIFYIRSALGNQRNEQKTSFEL